MFVEKCNLCEIIYRKILDAFYIHANLWWYLSETLFLSFYLWFLFIYLSFSLYQMDFHFLFCSSFYLSCVCLLISSIDRTCFIYFNFEVSLSLLFLASTLEINHSPSLHPFLHWNFKLRIFIYGVILFFYLLFFIGNFSDANVPFLCKCDVSNSLFLSLCVRRNLLISNLMMFLTGKYPFL